MDFDYTSETITPDQTTVLTINGTGSIVLPTGTTAQRVNNTGALRWNSSNTQPEIYNGTQWSNILHAGLFTAAGDILYATASDAVTRLPVGTNGQILTSNGTAPTWGNVLGSAFTAVVTPNTLVSGNYYSNTITHNLGTNNICVSVYDNSTEAMIIPHSLVQSDTNNLVITVIGNTRTYRVVIIANGASIQAGGSTPSSIIVQNLGVTLTGSPFTTINLASGLTATNTGSGVATITPAALPLRTLTYVATSFDSPNNADWTINALAATVSDPTNGAINVRSFSNTTEQGVGFLITIPSGATQMAVTYKGHAQVAGAGSAVAVQLRFYTRVVGASTPAAVSAWSAATNLTAQNVPTANIFWQTYTQTIALSAFSTALVAGELYQFELTRNVGVANNLAQNWLLGELTIVFS